MRYRVLLLIIVLAGVCIRCFPFVGVTSMGDKVYVPGDADSYYHLRRAEWTKENYPRVLEEDSYIYFPERGVVPWGPGYDFLLGSIAKVSTVFVTERADIESILFLVNPIIAGIAIILVYILSLRILSPTMSLLSATWFAFTPSFIAYSRYGNVDHHCIVATFFILLSLLLFDFLTKRPDKLSSYVPFSISLGLACMVHQGFAVVGGILICSYFVLEILCAHYRRRTDAINCCLDVKDVRAVFIKLFLVSAVFIFLASFSTSAGRSFAISFEMLSFFHVLLWFFGAAIVAFFCLAEAIIDETDKWRLGLLVLVLCFCVLLLFSTAKFLPTLVEGISYALGQSWFLGIAAESKPLIAYGLKVSTAAASVMFLITPFVLLILLINRLRKPNGTRVIAEVVFYIYALAIVGLGLSQYVFTPISAAFVAIGSMAVFTWLASSFKKIGVVIAICLGIAAIVPTINEIIRMGTVDRKSVSSKVEADMLAREIETTTPKTGGYFEVEPKNPPEYSIFANRDLGHLLVYRAKRPVVVNPFGVPNEYLVHNKEFAEFSLTNNPERAKEILDSLKSRYVLNTPLTFEEIRYYANLIDWPTTKVFHKNKVVKNAYVRLVNTRLFASTGSAIQAKGTYYPAIDYLRLVYESAATMKYSAKESFPKFAFYEVVPGAKLVGRAESGSVISAVLVLQTNRNRRFEYVNLTKAGEEGAWSMKFPYANKDVDKTTQVMPVGRVELTINRTQTSIDITNSDVIEGRVLSVDSIVAK